MTDEDGIGMFHRHNRLVYAIAIGLLVVGLVVGLAVFRGAKDTKQANDKADQFLAKLQDAGVQRLPSKDQVVRVLGSDGGAVCENPANSLSKATLFSMIMNGASGPGMRPVITDSRLLQGQLLIISVYCPEKLDKVKDFVNDLKTGDVLRG